MLIVKPLGVHSREETVVVFVYEVEVDVVVFQYIRNLPSLSYSAEVSATTLSSSSRELNKVMGISIIKRPFGE